MSKFKELTKDLLKDLKETEKKIVKVSVKHLNSLTKDLADLLSGCELLEDETSDEEFSEDSEYSEEVCDEPLRVTISNINTDNGGSETVYCLEIFGVESDSYKFEYFAKKSTRKYSPEEIKLGQSLMDEIYEIINLDSKLVEDILEKSDMPTEYVDSY